MDKNTKKISSIAIGFIVMAATLAIFFLSNTKTEISYLQWLALIFVLISELMLFLGIVFIVMQDSSSNKVFLSSGMISTLFIYCLITVISFFSKNSFENNENGFIIMQIVFIAITAIIIVLINVFAIKVKDTNEKTTDMRLFMNDLEKRLYSLKSNNEYSQYQKVLDNIYEKIKYGDKNGKSSVDGKIAKFVDELESNLAPVEDNNTSDIIQGIDKLTLLFNQRTNELLQSKRGRF